MSVSESGPLGGFACIGSVATKDAVEIVIEKQFFLLITFIS